MKLLLAVHSLESLAGAPLHTLDLCRGFRRIGHDVSAFTFYPGVVTDMLQEEGFAVFTPKDHRLLEDEPFDIVYLFHATCEALLGLIFAGRTPIVRGYIGKGSATANPINADFSNAVTYISEGVQEAMQGKEGWNSTVPTRIARNVYDDALIDRNAKLHRPSPTRPAFALVSNHAPPQLAGLLEEAARDGLCSFTSFGQPDNSVPITPQLLEPFDAVIAVGRTVLLAAAMGKPTYLCDVHGTEGWLDQGNYEASRLHSFSGRRCTVEDWGVVESQLLDTDRWPGADDLAWIRERVAHDHALSHRVTDLTSFFADTIRNAPPPVTPPDGHRSVFRLLIEEEGARIPGRKHRRLELVRRLHAAEQRMGRQASRLRESREQALRYKEKLRETQAQLARCRERLRESDRNLREERATTQGLRQRIGASSRPAGRTLLRIAGYLRDHLTR